MHDKHHFHDHDHDNEGRCPPQTAGDATTDYANHGVRFRFPSDWTLSEQSIEDETTISLQSDGTSFWMLVLFKSRPDPEDVLNTVVTAFEDDYEDVDVISAVDKLNGLPSLGRDLDFVCYDLVNSATVRTFQTSDLTVMVLTQGTDHELKITREQLQSITASLQCDDDD